MSRRILIQVSAPTVLIGVILFVACLVSAWLISRQQRDLAKILKREVTRLQAAEELKIRVRQLRFYTFLNLIDRKHARQKPIDDADAAFKDSVNRVQQVARTAADEAHVQAIRDGDRKYRSELAAMSAELQRLGKDPDYHQLIQDHPVRFVVDPCQELLEETKAHMEQTVQDGEEMSRLVRLAMLGLGVVAPLSGLLSGYGIARGLSRSIYQLSVRVQDMASHLDRKVGSVSIPVGGDIQQLDQQMQYVVRRVEEVARDYHRHQQEMLRAEQLSAVGQLAASVAHEVRNPLTSVKLLVEGALRPRNRVPLSDEDLHVIHGEIVRLEQTVQGFLDFARPPALERRTVDLRDVVNHALELVRARKRQQKVALEASLGDAPVSVDVDQGQFCSVLVNLLLNALDVMPTGGKLEVTLRPTAEGYRLDVADSGPGIAPAIADRLFTPFASTKATGTGLGLSISRRIVEEHGGRLTAANRALGGACFSVTLPAKEGNHRDTETQRSKTGGTKNGERRTENRE